MNDLRIELRFKNAILYNALVDLCGKIPRNDNQPGIANIIGHPSQLLGVSRSALAGLLNLHVSPYLRYRGSSATRRKPSAELIALGLGIDFEILFPTHLYARRFPRLLTRDTSSECLLPLSDVKQLAPSPHELLFGATEVADAINVAMATLSTRERSILESRFGLNGKEDKTLVELGEKFHVGPERIRQIEAKALRKLRHPLRSKIIEASL